MDIYDAEQQFLEGQQEMLQSATDPKLKQMITTHIEQTKGHISNLEQVFSLLGQPAKRQKCDGVAGLVTEARKSIMETKGVAAICDVAIAGGASKAEHYEIASYRDLIQGAQIIGQNQVVQLLQTNLQQEEQTAQLIEASLPQLLRQAAAGEQGTQSSGTDNYEVVQGTVTRY